MTTFITGVVSLTLLTVFISISVAVSLRFMHFPDLTIDGTVSVSAAVFAVVLANTHSTLLALMLATLTGMLCGVVTMFLHTKCGISKLLSGIIVMTGLYSVNLRIMNGSNYSILNETTWLDQIGRWAGSTRAGWPYDLVMILSHMALVTGLILILKKFFHGRPGVIIRGIGDNERAVARMGINTTPYKYLGLALANGIAGLGAALMVANQGFSDVTMGTGSLVLGLAGLILGERIVGLRWEGRDVVLGILVAAVTGMLVYQALWLLVLRIGVAPTDLKLFTAILLTAGLLYKGGKKGVGFYAGRVF